MRYFLDTEFLENGPSFPLILLSIGIVAENGREFYAVNADAPLELANDWVKANVLPHLGDMRVPIGQIGPSVQAFIKANGMKNFDGTPSIYERPEFWGYYADYDWVVFCQLFGTMMDLPKGWPMYCRDIKQLCDSLGNPALPKQTSTEHNALADAKWNLEAYKFLQSVHP
jgi:hypothetical protein